MDWTLGSLLGLFKECFKKEISPDLMKDLRIIVDLRNAYAHRIYPLETSMQLNQERHRLILEALRRTWQDLIKEYHRVIPS